MGEVLGGEDGGVLAGFAAGSRVARYLLEEQVGAGGQAVVFRARDERLRRLVALKVLGAGLAADEEFRRRFIRESRAAAAVEDPHIIPVHEAGEASGVLFIAMRYVPGGDVRTLLRRAGPLPPSQAAAIISPVASALDSAHAAGLVHRDVKPANMLLDVRPGRPDHVYLSDFGLSKGVLSLGLTGSGHFLGTPGYSAPEQIQGRPVDGRADQYALACTAFELLCGAAVFPRDEVLAVMYAHLSEPPPRLTARRPGTPAAADAVFTRTLAKEPADRYASCREFADALRGAFGLPPYHAAQETGPQLDHPPARITDHGVPAGSWPATQHRARHAQAGDGQTGPSGLSTFPPSQAQRKKLAAAHEDSEAKAADRRRGITRRAVLGLAAAGAAAGLAVTGWDLSHRTTAPPHPPTRRPSGGTPIWNTTIPNFGIGWGPAVAGDIVYVGNQGDLAELYAMRVSDGHVLWHRGAEGPLITKKTIYASTTDNNHDSWLAAYNASTGNLSWKLPTTTTAGPVISGGILYFVDSYGELHALNPINGRPLWTLPTAGTAQPLAVAGGIAYLASAVGDSYDSDGSLYAVRPGQQLWRFTSRGMITVGPVVVDGLVYFVSYSGNVYALRAGNGHAIWSSRIGAVPTGFRLAGDIIYIGGRNGEMHALRASDGKEVWRCPSSDLKFSIATGDDTVYIGNDDGEVQALRPNDGTEIWRFTTGGSSPVITIARNTVYIGSNNLYAIRATDGRQLWSFPAKVWRLTTAPGAVYASTGPSLYAIRA